MRLLVHLLSLVHDVDLVGTGIGLNADIVVDLPADIVHGDGGRLLMGEVDDIGLVPAYGLTAGVADAAGLCALLLALQSHGEGIGQHHFPGQLRSV